MCMCMYVLCYDVLCVAWCVVRCPLLLCPASLSVRGQVGIGVLLCIYIRTYSINYSTTLIIIIVIIIHTIQYIYYNYTHSKYDICLHYTVSCEEAMLYTNSCIYYSYTICICMLYPLWYIWLWIITSYTTLIYYTITIIITIILIYFLFLLLCCCMSACMCVCVVLCCLSCVCVCVLSCVSSHILIHVYLCVFTPAHPPGLCCGEEANVLI